MKDNNAVIAGIIGTSTFTLFSFLLAKTIKKNYVEPTLLDQMLIRVTPGMNEKQAKVTGWLIHYLIGIAFAANYNLLINKKQVAPTITNGAIAGTITGLLASFAWDNILTLHPAPPRKRSIDFYVQLVAGHAIFGITAFFILKRLNRVCSTTRPLQNS